MNQVNLIGNLARDPELRQGDNPVCKFTVAVSDGYGDNQKTSFIPVVAFGKTAENCGKYLAKGNKVGVSGRIQTGSYEKDGRKVYTTDIIAFAVEFLKTDGDTNNVEKTRQNENQSLTGAYQRVDDGDIPF